MQLTLLRHIQTQAPEGLCYGQSEPPLPDDFEKQHRQLARALQKKYKRQIYSSPLSRCALLAQAIAGDQKVLMDERLMELNFGDWEGLHWSEIEQKPEAQAFFDDYLRCAPPGGESFEDLIVRIEAFLRDLKKKHPRQQILVVSHGGPIRVVHGLAENLSPEHYFNRQVAYGHLAQICL